MEAFDANKDCVTGAEVYPWDMLKAATKQRFDGLPDDITGWSYLAALAILKDLSWRNVIGPALKGCDGETRRALTQRVCDIIEEASRETIEGLEAQVESFKESYDSMLNRSVAVGKNLSEATDMDSGRIFSTDAANVASHIRDLKRWIADVTRDRDEKASELSRLREVLDERPLPDISVIDRDGKTIKNAVMGVDVGGSLENPVGICVRILDLPETVDRIADLERQRDEAVARADVATYTSEALAAKCREMEARADGHLPVFKALLTRDYSSVTEEQVLAAANAVGEDFEFRDGVCWLYKRGDDCRRVFDPALHGRLGWTR